MTDLFVGTWDMQPEKNNYEQGDPPQSGVYIIEPDGEGYTITMKWRTVDGQDQAMSYQGTPNGEDHPAEAYDVDTMSMTRVNEHQLDSDARKGDVVVAYASRKLSEDGNQMTVTQSGKTPDGKDFTNTSVYVLRTD